MKEKDKRREDGEEDGEDEGTLSLDEVEEEPDKSHQEEGEGNSDEMGQRDVADTGDHGIGGEDGGVGIDDSNIKEKS